MDGTEDKKDGNPKKSTCEKHWAVIDQHNVAICVQLCSFVEGEEKKCAEYYSDKVGGVLKFGRYSLKTIDVKTDLKEFTDKKGFTLYTVEITNSKKKDAPKKTVDILYFSGWPDHGAPQEAYPALEMLKFCESYKKNVLVHCSAGVGRTGTLVAIKYGIELCLKKKVI